MTMTVDKIVKEVLTEKTASDAKLLSPECATWAASVIPADKPAEFYEGFIVALYFAYGMAKGDNGKEMAIEVLTAVCASHYHEAFPASITPG